MLFPRTVFANRNGIWRQWFHLLSEVLEVGVAIFWATIYGVFSDPHDSCARVTIRVLWDDVADELVDVQQSADTALHVVMDRHGADSYGAYTRVALRCQRRQYFAVPKKQKPLKGCVVVQDDCFPDGA